MCRKPLLSKEVSANPNSKSASGGLVGLEIKKISRKEFETRRERDAFFEEARVKGKRRASTEEVIEVKGESEEEKKIKPLKKDRRKRKRRAEPELDTGTVRASVDLDSLFDSS